MSHTMQMEEAASIFSVFLPRALIWLFPLTLFRCEQHGVRGVCFAGPDEA